MMRVELVEVGNLAKVLLDETVVLVLARVIDNVLNSVVDVLVFDVITDVISAIGTSGRILTYHCFAVVSSEPVYKYLPSTYTKLTQSVCALIVERELPLIISVIRRVLSVNPQINKLSTTITDKTIAGFM